MPDDQYRALARAIRGPMHRWWLRVGLWWLVVMVLAQAWLGFPYLMNDGMPLEHAAFYNSTIWRLTYYIGIPGYMLLPAGIWLAAAYFCRREIHAVISSAPLPATRRLDQLTFRLCYWQGLWPLGLTLAGAVAYSALAAAAGYFFTPVSLPLHLVVSGAIYLVFLAGGIMVWGLGMLVYAGRLYPALLWVIAWFFTYIAANWFPIEVHYHLRQWNLPFSPILVGAGLLLFLALSGWRRWPAFTLAAYAGALVIAAFQVSWTHAAVLPVALLRSSPPHGALLRTFGIDLISYGFQSASTRAVPTFYYFGPGYTTAGPGGYVDVSFSTYACTSGFSDGSYWLLLGIILLINLALIAVQFLLIDWILGHRVKH